jgi:hypothetical protein
MKFTQISAVVLALLVSESQAVRVKSPDHTDALKGILRTLAGEDHPSSGQGHTCGCGQPNCSCGAAQPAAVAAPVSDNRSIIEEVSRNSEK